MPNAEIFTVKDNINLQFNCEGKKYLMRLNIEEGIINLKEVKGEHVENCRTFFIGDTCRTYTVVAEEVGQELIAEKPKKKK